MKHVVNYIFLGLFFFSFCANAQKTKAELTFKDGTTKTGLGKWVGNRVKFKTHKKDKAIKYDFMLLEQVKMYSKKNVTVYVNMAVQDEEKPKILEEVIIGKVSLYQKISYGHSPGVVGGAGGGFGFSPGYSYSINNYYLKREGQTSAFHLGSTNVFSKNFKKAASDYFKDCSSLVKKIQNKEYKKKDIRAVVEFYNMECP